MSQKNVEIVQRACDEGLLDESSGRSQTRSAMTISRPKREVWSLVHRDAVWNTGDDRFGTFRGHLEIGAAWDDIFEIATDYAVSLREVVDCGGDRVFAAVDRIATAKGSGIRGTFPMFALIPVQNGVITRLDEYMDRSEALEAVGLGE